MAETAQTLVFELVAPEQLVVSEAVEMVVVPGREGDFGVLPGHAPLISTVRAGVIEVFEYPALKSKTRYFVAGGFAEVTPERCTVLSVEAVRLDQFDRADGQKRLEQAELDLRDAHGDEEKARFEEKLNTARALMDALASQGDGRH
jgi:F-type H+-transporting ATPase subunit epsilon